MVTHKNSAKLLSDFIALQLRTKRHNFFLNFLKESLNFIINQKFSRIKGIKVIIKGRLNNAARSRHYLIKVGKISLIKIKSKINYSESVAFTSNGTLGIKVWINEKI
jgi:small subunit ribosomal protein S3